jgi:precorrin-6A/cobalt-precorrin-6A reductase
MMKSMATSSESERGRNAAARPTILLLSGTSEGPVLAQALAAAGYNVRTTVTREEARDNLFRDVLDHVTVETRGFTADSLADFLQRKEADLVLDATHPFAVRITQLAHEVCKRLGVPYLRYERPDWTPPAGTHLVDSFAEAAQLLPSLGKRVLLTIGSKQLKHFAHLHGRLTLFARILPSPLSLEQALREGFTAEKVMCLRPPFSLEFNKAILCEYQIDVLVTKASGAEGGVVEKVTACNELDKPVIMIRRPTLPGIAAVSTVAAALAQTRALLPAPCIW